MEPQLAAMEVRNASLGPIRHPKLQLPAHVNLARNLDELFRCIETWDVAPAARAKASRSEPRRPDHGRQQASSTSSASGRTTVGNRRAAAEQHATFRAKFGRD